MKRFDLRQNPINGQFYMAESPTGEYVEYAALSHAAGQEAVAEVGRDGSIIWLALRPLKAGIKLYTHPRTCPSVEVERDAARYRKLKPMLLSADFEPEDYVGLTFALPAGTCVMANLDSIIDGIASSEVKGDQAVAEGDA